MLAVKHTAPKTVEVIEMPDPSPAAGEVVVAMKAGGICGSDLHVYRREPWQPPLSNVLGHEPCGVVEAVGEGVAHLSVGDRVTVYHYEGCGYCQHCRTGELHWCDQKRVPGWHKTGSCAQKVTVKAANALPLPDELSFADGALIACGAGTTWSALRKITPTAEHSAVVFGLGPVGLCGVAMLAAFGCRVVAVGRRASRLELAEKFGAETVIDIDQTDDPVDAVKRVLPDGANLGYETTGRPDGQRQLVASLARFGRAAVVGIGTKEPAVNLSSITGPQIALHGSHVLNFGEYENLTRFMIDKNLQLDRMVTHRYPYDEGREAFDMADHGDCAKVVLEG